MERDSSVVTGSAESWQVVV